MCKSVLWLRLKIKVVGPAGPTNRARRRKGIGFALRGACLGQGLVLDCFWFQLCFLVRNHIRLVLGGACAPQNQSEPVSNHKTELKPTNIFETKPGPRQTPRNAYPMPYGKAVTVHRQFRRCERGAPTASGSAVHVLHHMPRRGPLGLAGSRSLPALLGLV